MQMTIAICTWNRCKLLDKTLTQMRQLLLPEGISWEILVIDNNCTDATAEVINRHKEYLPIRKIVEDKQGHSHARNRAIDECNSDWLIYTDDDVLVSLEWLTSYAIAISVASKMCGFLGGPIEAWFEVEPSVELVEAIPSVGEGFCGVSVPVDLMISRHSETLPYGANFGIRRSLLKGMRFDTNLGLRKGSRVVGEEIDFMRRLLDRGIEGKWVPNAFVRHWIPKQRITLRYLAGHIYGAGRTSAKLRMERERASRTEMPQIPKWMYRRLMESMFLMIWNKALGRRVHFYRNFDVVFHHLGYIKESLTLDGVRHSKKTEKTN
jgi:glycosyltransferase involved in cell wall biosynthesis